VVEFNGVQMKFSHLEVRSHVSSVRRADQGKHADACDDSLSTHHATLTEPAFVSHHSHCRRWSAVSAIRLTWLPLLLACQRITIIRVRRLAVPDIWRGVVRQERGPRPRWSAKSS